MGVEEGEEEGSGDTSSAAADTPDLLFLTFPFASTSDPGITSSFRDLLLASV